jgi:hypothetical protein
MALELPGVTVIEHPHEARARARKWSRMAREIDTPDAPPEAKAKATELRQRAEAANAWARRQEDALDAGNTAHDEHLKKVTPIRGGTAQQQHGDVVAKPAANNGEGFARAQAREAGHRAYTAARPVAMRAGNHLFQGVKEPFGPVASGWDLFFEALGITIGIVILSDLVRAPRAIGEVSSHGLAGLHRLVGVVDPITGLAPGTPRPAARATAAPAKPVPHGAAVASH